MGEKLKFAKDDKVWGIIECFAGEARRTQVHLWERARDWFGQPVFPRSASSARKLFGRFLARVEFAETSVII